MSVDLFSSIYSFRPGVGAILADDEKGGHFSLSGLQIEAILSHAQQNSKGIFEAGQREVFIGNLLALCENVDGKIFQIVKRTIGIVLGIQHEIPAAENRLTRLVGSLYDPLIVQGPVEEEHRKLTVDGLTAYHYAKLTSFGFEREIQELQPRDATCVEGSLWALAKRLIHEISEAGHYNEEALTQHILERLRGEKEDLLYMLHMTIGGLLKQPQPSSYMTKIKQKLQETYESWAHRSAARAAQLFQGGSTFEEALQYVQKERQNVAYECFHIPPDGFGRKRELPLYTPVEGKYLPWLSKILECVPEGEYGYSKVRGFEDLSAVDTSHLRVRTVYGEMGQRKVPLTSYLVSTRFLPDPVYQEIMYYEEKGEDAPDYIRAVLCHAPPQAYTLVMKHLCKLTQQFLGIEAPPEKLIQIGVEIHWWFAHLCPLDRGSAAAGEVLFEGLYAARGLQVEWNKQMPPDLLLLTTPHLADAQTHYKKYFNTV